MSWQEKRRMPYVINTGDGQRYVPKTIDFGFSISYQSENFEFIGVDGTLVKKTTQIGTRFPAVIFFDDTNGEDHLDIVKRFRKSCNDTRPWTIEHPLYDIIIVQVVALEFDDSAKNVTKVTCTFIETILDGQAGVSINPIDQIPILFDETLNDLEVSLSEVVQPEDISRLNQDVTTAYKRGVPIINPLTDEFETYYNAFNTALSFVDTATATPLLMMRSVMRVLSLPAQFQASVLTRINLLRSTMDDLRSNLLNKYIKVSSKQLFQNEAGSVLCAMCLAAGDPLPTDYKNAVPVLEIIDLLVSARRQYIDDLDLLQSPNGGNVLSFVANVEALISLNELVNITISALYNISLGARSQRVFICDKDTNIIILAHRFYGLEPSDTNINDLYEANNLSGNEHFLIEKGRKILYYI